MPAGSGTAGSGTIIFGLLLGTKSSQWSCWSPGHRLNGICDILFKSLSKILLLPPTFCILNKFLVFSCEAV